MAKKLAINSTIGYNKDKVDGGKKMKKVTTCLSTILILSIGLIIASDKTPPPNPEQLKAVVMTEKFNELPKTKKISILKQLIKDYQFNISILEQQAFRLQFEDYLESHELYEQIEQYQTMVKELELKLQQIESE